MYPITNEVKALFEANEAKVVRITGSTVRILPTDIAVYSGNTLVYQSGDSKRLKLYSGSSEIYDNQGTKTVILYSGDKPIFINDEAGMPIQLNITSSDVRQGDFSIDRYSCNGQLLEIGTAIASEFTLQLDNVEGQFDGVVFEGVELFVEIGISDPADSDAEIIWVPCGYFTCDHQPRRLNTLSITALDRMMRFDKKPTSGSLTLPKTVAQLVAAGCAACNVALGQSLSGLPNANYSVTALPDNQDGISWRDIIRWCAGLMGTNAWIDWNGELRFSWYNNDTGYVSTTDNRFSSDLYENPIIITGVKFTDTDEANTTYIAGTEDYAIDVSDNGFINADNANALLPNIYLAMNGFAYTPFSASAIAAPYLWPMDRVTFTDKNGKGHVSVLTNVNLSVNGSTDIAAVGESAEFYSYGKSSSFTAQQQATLRRLRRVVGSEINDAVESATAQITGAQGGYVRFMYDTNGIMTEILIMDTPDITTATKVWRWNQGGFGYSSNGYQGPYTTAITQDGAIVATFITTGVMSADRISGGVIDGDTVVAKLINIIDANNNTIASFNNKITLGRSTSYHAEITNAAFILVDNSGNTITSIGSVSGNDIQTSHSEVYYPRHYMELPFRCTDISSLKLYADESLVPSSEYSLGYLGTRLFYTVSGTDYVTRLRAEYYTDEPIKNTTLGTRSSKVYGAYSCCLGNNCISAGSYSLTEGRFTQTYGNCAHAEGRYCIAASEGSHAEGSVSSAYGRFSHAEGDGAKAYGNCGHAEGEGTKANGDYSHAQGYETIANGIAQNTFGSKNIQDDENRYIEIVGNAEAVSYSHRSNARTLDWSGNEWIAGTLTQASDSRLKEESGEVPDLSDIRARRFKWNDKKGTHDDIDHIGYFAQDVEKVAPYLVQEDAMGYKSLDYIALLCAKVEYLERRVQQLENEVKRHDD